MCKNIPYSISEEYKSRSHNSSSQNFKNKTKYEICNNERDIKLKKVNDKKFMYTMIISLIGLLCGTVIASKYPKLVDSGIGIGFGSTLTLLVQIIANWSQLQQDFKLIVLGATLFGLTYGSYKLIK